MNISKNDKRQIKEMLRNFKYDVNRLHNLNEECCQYCKFDTTLYPRVLTEEEQKKFENLDKERLELLTHCRIVNDKLRELTKLERDVIEYIIVREYSYYKTTKELFIAERSISNILNKVYIKFYDYVIK